MKFALQRCCGTSIFLKQYEASTDAVLEALGVERVEIQEFNCCGYPLKNLSHMTYLLSSSRNLALAEARGLNIMTVCACCYGSLREANQMMKEDSAKREGVNSRLEKEGLSYGGGVEVRHVLDILYKEVGIEGVGKKVVKPFEGLKIATHYGCHLLRPRQVVAFDNPYAPSILDKLVEVTGAESVSWQSKLECCGSPLWGVNDELSMDIAERKTRDARDSGADYLCVVCPFCQLQFDRVQRILMSKRGRANPLPSILYTQLLGLSLGIAQNELDLTSIKKFLK
jgi:heterodisulfide reductase subunit B